MERQDQPTQKRGLTAIDGALAVIALLLIVQMWLLTATLESYLAGHHDPAGPAFLASMILTAACGGLYLMVLRLDKSRAPEELPPSSSGPWQI